MRVSVGWPRIDLIALLCAGHSSGSYPVASRLLCSEQHRRVRCSAERVLWCTIAAVRGGRIRAAVLAVSAAVRPALKVCRRINPFSEPMHSFVMGSP